MPSWGALRRILWLWIAPLAALSGLALAFVFYYRAPHERAHQPRMTAGDARGTRHQLAQVLRSNAAHFGLQLELVETAGSEVALDRVNNHALDLALVQGGLRFDGRDNVRQV